MSAVKIIISVQRRLLSDGSPVYSVVMHGHEYPCITERDAQYLSDSFQEAINSHTNESATVRYEY